MHDAGCSTHTAPQREAGSRAGQRTRSAIPRQSRSSCAFCFAHRSAGFGQQAARRRLQSPGRSCHSPHQRSQCQIHIGEERRLSSFFTAIASSTCARACGWAGSASAASFSISTSCCVGEYDAFPIKAGRLDILPQVRYILTLDSDTQLPRGSARRHGRRHRASAESGHHRSQAAYRRRRIRHPAAARRGQRQIGSALAAGRHLLRSDGLRHLHSRGLGRLPGPLRRRHLHRQGHLRSGGAACAC